MARIPVCLLVLAATGGTAAAQHARFPRQQPPPPAVVLSAHLQPPAVPAAPTAARPTVNADSVLSIESLRTVVRSEQEQILAQLIENTADSEVEEKADYYFRLAELYAKQHRLYRDTDANKAKQYLLKTVKTFKGLTDNEAFRNYPKMDVALFYYGYTLQSGKYLKEARAVYDKLLKNYPSSKYVPEAHLAFADYYFDAGQLADAEARYKRVLEFPKSTAYTYALYKMGWIHLMLERNQEALETFFQVVHMSRNDAARAPLHAAAKADFVRAYVKIGKPDKRPDKAFEAFERVARGGGVEMVEQLAVLARETGAHDRALTAYRSLVAKNDNDARACRWQYEVARGVLFLPGASNADKVKEISALTQRFTSRHHTDAECRGYAEAMAGELAVAYHAEWSKTQNAETLGYAEQLYAAHTSAFPADAERRAAYAEVLWTRADREANAKQRARRWQLAAQIFGELGTRDGARASVLAWMNAVDAALPADAGPAIARAPRAKPRAQPMDTASSRLVASLAAYLAHTPDVDGELARMRLAVALVQRKHKQFDEAASTLDALLEQHPDDPSSELAANLLLDSLVQGRMLDEVLVVVDAMALDTDFLANKPQLQRNIASLRSRSIR